MLRELLRVRACVDLDLNDLADLAPVTNAELNRLAAACKTTLRSSTCTRWGLDVLPSPPVPSCSISPRPQAYT